MPTPIDITRLSPLAERLHRSPALRGLAKRFARRLVLTQRFHGGRIAFNAVTHSWAWTGGRRYENFDRPLQDRLLQLSQTLPNFLDIGANVGAMTLSVLLRNARARAVAVEPGAEASALLRRSVTLNGLGARCEVLAVAASAGATRVHFDAHGSVVAHVTDTGPEVPALSLADLAQRVSPDAPLLAKIDVEGYETTLVPALCGLPLRSGSCALIELHPAGFNGLGDPLACYAAIHAQPAIELRSFGGGPAQPPAPAHIQQIELHWR